jgi:hypothetical protein
VDPGFSGSLCTREMCNVDVSLLTVSFLSNKVAKTITITISGYEKLP